MREILFHLHVLQIHEKYPGNLWKVSELYLSHCNPENRTIADLLNIVCEFSPYLGPLLHLMFLFCRIKLVLLNHE